MGVCGVGISAKAIWLVHRPEHASRPTGVNSGRVGQSRSVGGVECCGALRGLGSLGWRVQCKVWTACQCRCSIVNSSRILYTTLV